LLLLRQLARVNSFLKTRGYLKMNTLIICLLIAAILPYLARIPVASAMAKAGGYNNDEPRAQQALLHGFGGRAVAAHKNSFEALIIFGLAVVTALATSHITPLIEYLAIAFIVSRVIYHIIYLMGISTLRSLIWFVGLVCSLTIMGLCIN